MKTKVDIYVIQKIRERREVLGISQEALSYKLNKSESYIGQFESGGNKYNINQINEIAKVLNCSPQDFIPKEPL